MKEFLSKAGHKNLYICYYEDFKANPVEQLKKLDVFLGTKMTDEQITKVGYLDCVPWYYIIGNDVTAYALLSIHRSVEYNANPTDQLQTPS